MRKHTATINELRAKIRMMEDDTLSKVAQKVNTFCSEIRWVADYLASEHIHGVGVLQLIEDLMWLNNQIKKLDTTEQTGSVPQISRLASTLLSRLGV